MGEWTEEEDAIRSRLYSLLNGVNTRERAAIEAWKRGEPAPDDVPQMGEAPEPKRAQTGNRKTRRARTKVAIND